MSEKRSLEESYRLKLAKKRKRKALISFSLWSILLIVVCVSIFFLYTSPFITLNEIQIKGEDDEMNKKISEITNSILPISIFSLDKEQLKQSITNSSTLIKNVEVHKRYIPRASANVSYELREPYGIYCIPSAWCTPFDDNGIAINEISSDFAPSMKIINQMIDSPSSANDVAGKEIIEKQVIDQFKMIENAIKDTYLEGLLNVNRLEIIGEDSFRIIMDTSSSSDAFYFVVDRDSLNDASSKIFLALKTLDNFNDLKYVDIRFGNKIYWYNKEE